MKKKINVWFMIISAIAIVITALLSTMIFYHILMEQVFADLKSYEQLVREIDLPEYNLPDNEVRITWIAEDGTVLYDSEADISKMENHKDRPEVINAKQYGETREIRQSQTLSVQNFYYASLCADGTILRVSRKSYSFYQVMLNTVAIILGISLVTLLFCTLGADMLTKRMVKSIERMADNMAIMDSSEIYEEIRPFVATIKEQHVNILNSAKVRQEFTANVSHELKTPLTAISGYAELLDNDMVQKEDVKHFAHQIQKSSNRLLALINDIIKLSELDDSELEMPMEELDLYELVQNSIQNMQMNAQKQDVTLMLYGSHASVRGNINLLEELICNLISNAIRYNVSGGKVYVQVQSELSSVSLIVEDTGIGIPKEHQERIFERFYRVDKSRSKSSGGTGLGLAIVKHIVAQHDASIELESEEGKGTKIIVKFVG